MRRVIFLSVILAFASYAQELSWPGVFALPETAQPVDSAALQVRVMMEADEDELKGKGTLTLRGNDESHFKEQAIRYQLEYDPYHTHATHEHFLDLSGQYLWKNSLLRSQYIGLQWQPIGFLNRRVTENLSAGDIAGHAEGRLDAGGMIQYSLLGAPLQIGTGISATTWNTTMPKYLFDTHLNEFSTDVGWYGHTKYTNGSFELGEYEIFSNLSAFGLMTGHAGIFKGSGEILVRRELGTGDSIFVFAGDTVTVGNDAFLSEIGEEQRYIERPDIRGNALMIGPGLKGKSRLFLIPAVAYLFSLSNQRYPYHPQLLRDESRQLSTIYTGLRTDSTFFLEYGGMMQFDWGSRDWLYHDVFYPELPADTLQKAYNWNLQDVETFGVAMKHRLGKIFKNGMGFIYLFDISRNSRTYPNEYLRVDRSRIDTFYNDESRDVVNFRHSLELMVLSLSYWDLQLRGEYLKTIISYIDKNRSGVNSSDSTFALGFSTAIRPFENLEIVDTTRVEADITRYHYPQVHTGDPPPYSRSFFSHLKLQWTVNPRLGLRVNWRERYDDRGKWYGVEYMDTTMTRGETGDRSYNYYGRLLKTWEHTITASVSWRFYDNNRIKIGCEYNDIYAVEWDPVIKDYIVEMFDRGYRIHPFIEWKGRMKERFLVDLSVRPIFYVKRSAGGAKYDINEAFFDFHLALQAIF